jgi:hypothetical protein
VEHEDPIDLTVTLPPGSPLDGPALRGHLEDELRTRAEVVAAEGHSVTVRAYRREEVEAVADELIAKLSKIERVKDGTSVRWVDDSGSETVRPI